MSSKQRKPGDSVYDVLYRDPKHSDRVIAAGLNREAACELARSEASRRQTGRMFAAGSDLTPVGDVVLIVDSKQHAAA
jgi:hypothetical protein